MERFVPWLHTEMIQLIHRQKVLLQREIRWILGDGLLFTISNTSSSSCTLHLPWLMHAAWAYLFLSDNNVQFQIHIHKDCLQSGYPCWYSSNAVRTSITKTIHEMHICELCISKSRHFLLSLFLLLVILSNSDNCSSSISQSQHTAPHWNDHNNRKWHYKFAVT